MLGRKALLSQTKALVPARCQPCSTLLCSPCPQIFSMEGCVCAQVNSFLWEEAWRLGGRRLNLSPPDKAARTAPQVSSGNTCRLAIQISAPYWHAKILMFGTWLLLHSPSSTPCFPNGYYIYVKCHLDVIILLWDLELACLRKVWVYPLFCVKYYGYAT